MPAKNKKTGDVDLAGGYSSNELKALRRLERSLAADGYDVAKVALGAGGRPAAVVYLGRPSDPFRLMMTAARTFLRAVESVGVGDGNGIEVGADDLETLATLRVTARVVSEHVVPEGEPPETVGEVAHVDFARAALRGDRDDE